VKLAKEPALILAAVIKLIKKQKKVPRNFVLTQYCSSCTLTATRHYALYISLNQHALVTRVRDTPLRVDRGADPAELPRHAEHAEP
jgi:hypothetical protein